MLKANNLANHVLHSNPAGASWLQSLRPERRVAIGSLGGHTL
jgi:hypothetical protein